MKVKLKDLHPNPYKNMINEGKLNQIQIDKLKANLKDLGPMGSFPVVKRKGELHLVSHHHRVEALKQEYSLDYEVEVDLKDYSDEQLFKGMIIENLTQRDKEFREEMENCSAIEDFLNNNPEELKRLRAARKGSKKDGMTGEYKFKATYKDIAFWLDPSEKVISHDTVRNLLLITKNLHPKLVEKYKKKEISQTIAVTLSEIDEKDEQRDLANALEKCTDSTVKQKSELLKKYKMAPDDVKKGIRNGDINLNDVNSPVKVDTEIIPRFDKKFEQTKDNSNKLTKQLDEFTNIFKNKEFSKQYNKMKPEQKEKFSYNFKSMLNQIKECYENAERLVSKLPDKGLLKKDDVTNLIDNLEKMLVYIKGHYLYAINRHRTLFIRFKLKKKYPVISFSTKHWIKGAKFYLDDKGRFMVDMKKIVLSKEKTKITIPTYQIVLKKEFDDLKSNCKKSLFELPSSIYDFIKKYEDKAPFLKLKIKGKKAEVVLYDTSLDQTFEESIQLNEAYKSGNYFLSVKEICILSKLGFTYSKVLLSKDGNYYLIKEGTMEAIISTMNVTP